MVTCTVGTHCHKLCEACTSRANLNDKIWTHIGPHKSSFDLHDLLLQAVFIVVAFVHQ